MKRKVDREGRITIPIKYRKDYGLYEGQLVEITVEYGVICVKSYTNESIYKRPYTGIVRRVDQLGRVIIPFEYLKLLGILRRGECFITIEDEQLKIQKKDLTKLSN